MLFTTNKFSVMGNLAIFFGPEGGAVNRVANLLASKLEPGSFDLISINGASASDIGRYETIIFGLSTIGRDTWDQKFGNIDWSKFMPVVSQVDFTGKKVAIFGLGDHITYAFHFVNSMGILARIVQNNGGTLLGKVSAENYEFSDSEAVEEGMFLGLPLDEDFQPELTDGRLSGWVTQLKAEF